MPIGIAITIDKDKKISRGAAVNNNLLNEDGTNLLLEDGGFILLEN